MPAAGREPPQGAVDHAHRGEIDVDEAPGPLAAARVRRRGVRQGGVELEVGAGELGQVLHPQQGGGGQLGADGGPVRLRNFGEVEKDALEHAPLEPAEPGQGGPGLGAEAAEREVEGGEQGAVAALGVALVLELMQAPGELLADGLGGEVLEVRGNELDGERVVLQPVEEGLDLLAPVAGALQVDGLALHRPAQQVQGVRAGETGGGTSAMPARPVSAGRQVTSRRPRGSPCSKLWKRACS